jgi:H+/gluconate symporter-like permease
MKMIRKAVANGENFVAREGDHLEKREDLPNPFLSLIPLAAVLLVSFFFHDFLEQSALILALTSGIMATLVLNWKYFRDIWHAVSDGTMGALVAIGNTAAVVGFGGVAKITPAFDAAVNFMTSIPGSPLIGGALAVMVIAGLTGSSSGGQSIALPILGPHYLDLGINPEALHRTVTLSSGILDTLPHGGYTVTTIRSICNESFKDAYPGFGTMTVVITMIGVVLAIILFSFGIGT